MDTTNMTTVIASQRWPLLNREVRGHHDYDLLIGSMTRSAIPAVVGACAVRWPTDFRLAAGDLDPVAMIILSQHLEANLAVLTDPGFDPINVITSELGTYSFAVAVEESRFGREIDVTRELGGIEKSLRTLDADAAKALWAGLAFSQWPEHREDERRLNRWLDPNHLATFVR